MSLMNIWAVCAITYLIINIWPHKDFIKLIDGTPRLSFRRYYIWRSKWSRWLGLRDNGNRYLHIFLRSDADPDPHTHPWKFTTKVLFGGYINELWMWRDKPDPFLGRRVGRHFIGRWPVKVWGSRTRDANHIHRVFLHENKSTFMRMLFGQLRPAITFVKTGPFEQLWHFVTESGYVVFWEYLNIPKPTLQQLMDDDL